MLFRIGISAIGVVLLGFTFWQIFEDLFHPIAQGSLSRWIARSVWRTMKKKESLLNAAGPVSFILVVFTWALLVVLGFALIYWPQLPANFRFNGRPEHGFLAAAYFSTQCITTLSFNDIMPKAIVLRFLATFESMIGLGLVTASVSWTALLYPALSRMRLLSRDAVLLSDVSKATGIPVIGDNSEDVLSDLTEKVVQASVDLVYFPIVYYFHAAHRRYSLANAIPVLVNFSEQATAEDKPDRVRLAAMMLRQAVEDLVNVIGESFLGKAGASMESVLQAFAEDQQAGSTSHADRRLTETGSR